MLRQKHTPAQPSHLQAVAELPAGRILIHSATINQVVQLFKHWQMLVWTELAVISHITWLSKELKYLANILKLQFPLPHNIIVSMTVRIFLILYVL